jgi:hypothetical protein
MNFFVCLFVFWGNYTLPPEVSTHFHFCLQSLKCDTLPPQTFKLWQFNPFGLFIPKMPPTLFFLKEKKPPHRWWPATRFLFFGFFFFRKKNAGGILGINRPNGLNCHNLKV